MFRKGVLLPFLIVLTGMLAAAQSHARVVTMSVTLPDGQTQELTATESGLATVSLKDATEYGFRPTIQDNTPLPKVSPPATQTGSTSSFDRLLYRSRY